MKRSAIVVFAASIFALASASFCAACGGPTPSPSPSGALATEVDASASHSTPPETFAEVNPADLAELDAGFARSAAATPAAPAPPAPPPDECTPVGVDFEKRARPKLKECYAAGKKKDPNLEGTVKVTVEIDMLGKIKSTKITDKTLPDAVAQCMLKVVKATPFPDAAKCPGKAITIPMTFPTPR